MCTTSMSCEITRRRRAYRICTTELDALHDKAKLALNGEYDEEESQGALEDFYEALDEVQMKVVEASEALDKLYEFFSKAEGKLESALYADEME